VSIKLLPAAVNPVDPSRVPDVPGDGSRNVSSNVSNSLVPLAQSAITTRAGQVSAVPSTDVFTWSSRTRPAGVNWIDATVVEDSQSDEAGHSAVEYISGWAWSSPIERTVIAHYLFYAAGLTNGTGRLVNLYA
jgi:hypothetical protein